LRRPPTPTLFPYTTLFRSLAEGPPSSAEKRKASRRLKASRRKGRVAKDCRPNTTPTPNFSITGSFLAETQSVENKARGCNFNGGDRKSTRLNSSHLVISYA